MARRSVTVNVLFTDLVESTRLIGRLGADRADELRRSHDDAVRAAISRHGGHVVKHTGDGLMAVFESATDAVAAAEAARRAVALARRRDPDIPEVRVGVAAGDAAHEDGDWFGPPVIEAARLCADADGGQVLLTQVVALLASARSGRRSRPLGERTLKGFDEPVEVFELPLDDRPELALLLPDGATAALRGPLVGREEPQRVLSRSWSAARDGTPQVALVTGEPGVGKTRLAAALAQEANADGALVLWGRCDEDLSVAQQPFAEAIRQLAAGLSPDELRDLEPRSDLLRLVPELAELLPELPAPAPGDPDDERLRLFDAVSSLLFAVSRLAPVLLVIDDVHWAAPATVQQLRHLSRAPSPAALMILATYRDTEPARATVIDDALADLWRAGNVRALPLVGLDAPAVAELVAAAAGRALDDAGRDLARAVRAATDGNPFFVGQVLRHLTETGAVHRLEGGWELRHPITDLGLPQGVREVVGRRLDRLSAGARTALVPAAVAGQEFDLEVLRRVVGGTDGSAHDLLDLLDEAVAARLIEEVEGHPGRYAFVHALVRQSLLAELTATKRAQLHGRIGSAMADQPREDPVAVAHHLCAGSPIAGAADAMRWCLLAIEDAGRRLDHQQVVELAGNGLDAADFDDPGRSDHFRDRASLRLASAAGRNALGDIPGAKADFLAAAADARRAGDVERMVEAALGRVGWGLTSTPDPEGRALLEELRGLVAPEDDATLASIEAALAFYLGVFERQGDAGLALARAAHRRADRSGDLSARWDALVSLSFLVMAGADTEAQLEVITDLERTAGAIGSSHPGLRFHPLRQRVPLHVQLGERRAERAAVEAVAAMNGPADRVGNALVTMWRGMDALMDGDLDRCEALLPRLAELARDDVNLVSSWAAQLTYLRWEQHRLGEIVELLEQAATDVPGLVALRALLACVLAEQGDHGGAARHLGDITANDLSIMPRDNVYSAGITQLTSACTRLGDHEAARTLHPHVSAFSGQLIVIAWGVACLGAADRHLAGLDALLGRHDDADRRFAAALAMEERADAPALAARTRLSWGRYLLGRGSRHEARAGSLLRDAAAGAESLGLIAIAEEAQELL